MGKHHSTELSRQSAERRLRSYAKWALPLIRRIKRGKRPNRSHPTFGKMTGCLKHRVFRICRRRPHVSSGFSGLAISRRKNISLKNDDWSLLEVRSQDRQLRNYVTRGIIQLATIICGVAFNDFHLEMRWRNEQA